MNVVRTFPAARASVPAARRFVLAAVPDLPRATSDDLAILVSELATNCVQHANTGFRIAVERSNCRVRIEMTDTGPGRVGMRAPATTEPHGRGLQIVDALADDWGAIPAASTAGKTVWFMLDVLADTSGARGAHAMSARRPPSAELLPSRRSDPRAPSR